MAWLVIGFLVIFAIASLLYQIKPLQRPLRKIDRWNLLPNYSFFAPKPLTNDYRLLYRVTTEDAGEWVEIPMYHGFRASRVVWNPYKYQNKALVDTCNFLVAEFNALQDKHFIRVSLHYLTILVTISRHLGPARRQGQKVRFAIVESAGANNVAIERVLFASYTQLL